MATYNRAFGSVLYQIMKKLKEGLSPIQRQRARTRVDTALSRRGNIDRGSGMSSNTRRTAQLNLRRQAARMGPTARRKAQEKKYGQQIASTDRGLTAYNKIFEMLINEGVKGAESKEMKKVGAIGKAAKEKARIAALMKSNKKGK